MLTPDDMLVIYTDGVTEAQDETDALFGRQRLRDLLAEAGQCSASALIGAVNCAVDAFTSAAAQADDITCLALRVTETPKWRAPRPAPPAMLVLELANGLDELQRLAAALHRFGADLELPPPTVGEFALALDELIGNTLVHGYARNGEGVVDVRVEFDSGWLTATLRDTAPPYNPLLTPVADPDLALDDRKIGGLGVHLARSLSDEMQYRYLPGQNILTVRKRIGSGS